jgi:exonuclease III
MADEKEGYNVVFSYTKETGGYEGVVTWSHFASKEAFEEWYDESLKKRQRVLEPGVTIERAVELSNLTPRACMMAAALQEATDKETGKVNKEILQMKLATMATAGRL